MVCLVNSKPQISSRAIPGDWLSSREEDSGHRITMTNPQYDPKQGYNFLHQLIPAFSTLQQFPMALL